MAGFRALCERCYVAFMRVVEANANRGKVGVLIVPFPRHVSDALGLTLAVTNSAKYFRYQAILVANTDFIRAWVGSPSGSNPQLRPIWEKSTVSILGPYASTQSALEGAGESVLSGYVERWLSDLATHWRHQPGTVPAEQELAAAGVELVGEAAPAVA